MIKNLSYAAIVHLYISCYAGIMPDAFRLPTMPKTMPP